jgi:hypothetical protein
MLAPSTPSDIQAPTDSPVSASSSHANLDNAAQRDSPLTFILSELIEAASAVALEKFRFDRCDRDGVPMCSLVCKECLRGTVDEELPHAAPCRTGRLVRAIALAQFAFLKAERDRELPVERRVVCGAVDTIYGVLNDEATVTCDLTIGHGGECFNHLARHAWTSSEATRREVLR